MDVPKTPELDINRAYQKQAWQRGNPEKKHGPEKGVDGDYNPVMDKHACIYTDRYANNKYMFVYNISDD